MYEIRPFMPQLDLELRGLKKLCEEEMGWEAPQEYLEEWMKAVVGVHNQDPNLAKVAVAGGGIIGYCISVKRLHNYDGVVMDVTWRSAYIWDLFVLKEYRNRGVGTALLNDAFAYLKSIGVSKAGLLVNYWNESARRLFEKMGFREWSHFLVKNLEP
jgi:ribosomal protein S18 acetylase RimI-like enzyme